MSIFDRYKPIATVEKFDPEPYCDTLTTEEDAGAQQRPSLLPFYLFKGVVVLLLIAKLLELQIVFGTQNLVAAQGNYIRKRVESAPRGIIVDVKGRPLVQNIAQYNLEIFPGELPKVKGERLKLYEVLIEQFEQDREKLINLEEKQINNLDPIILKENLSHDEAISLEVRLMNYAGVEVVKRPTREYLAGEYMSHVLGYIGKISEQELKDNSGYRLDSYIGKTGIERQYEQYLAGQDGYTIVEVDSLGKVQQVKPGQDPQIGNNIRLTIDLDLQKIIEQVVNDYRAQSGNHKITVILAEPKTGAIRGIVSSPGYDSNQFVRGIKQEDYQVITSDPLNPLLNRAVSGQYPSGSTIKPFYAYSALNEGTITASTRIETPAAITIGQWTFPDWRYHGWADVRKAIAESNNIFFYALGGGYDKIKGLGVERMGEYLSAFGFGEKTGIDLSAEKNGLIPNPDFKKRTQNEPWYIGDTYHLAIGQGGFLTTPLQMTMATVLIANRGIKVTPHFLEQIEGMAQQPVFESKDMGMTQEHLQIVREGMRQTITNGSAGSLNSIPASIAGKTGTAQFGNAGRTHSWFTSFAPYEDPQYSLTVLVEDVEPTGSAAVPLARQIYSAIYPQN